MVFEMNIKIPDHITGVERAMILEIYPIVYALRLYKGSNKQAAEFLNISQRCLRDKIKRILELKAFYKQLDVDGINPHESEEIELDPLRKIRMYHLRKGMNSFWYHQATLDEREAFIKRINRMYSVLNEGNNE